MNNSTDVLRTEENGVEYFTVITTGKSGMSQRGLARACGKYVRSIQNLIENLTNGKAPKRLQSFIGQNINLTNNYVKKGGSVIVYKSNFCFAVIRHYDKLGSQTAEETLDAIGNIGIESYIQGKTGWLPDEYQTSQESRDLLDLLILSKPEKRSIHFNEEWQKEACRVTAYPWEGMPMAKFIRRSVYDGFPGALVERLKGVNPYVDDKRRANKHYQHFERNLDENVLKQHIRDVLGVLKMSTSIRHFWQLMNDRFGDGIQLDLDIQ